jgi:arginase family enzyme
MHRLDDEGTESCFELLRSDAERPTYVTFDIDSVDPAFAPGTGEFMVGGFNSREVLDVVRGVFDASANVVGADVVEVAPSLDADGRTSALAAHVLAVMVDAICPAKTT